MGAGRDPKVGIARHGVLVREPPRIPRSPDVQKQQKRRSSVQWSPGTSKRGWGRGFTSGKGLHSDDSHLQEQRGNPFQQRLHESGHPRDAVALWLQLLQPQLVLHRWGPEGGDIRVRLYEYGLCCRICRSSSLSSSSSMLISSCSTGRPLEGQTEHRFTCEGLWNARGFS